MQATVSSHAIFGDSSNSDDSEWPSKYRTDWTGPWDQTPPFFPKNPIIPATPIIPPWGQPMDPWQDPIKAPWTQPSNPWEPKDLPDYPVPRDKPWLPDTMPSTEWPDVPAKPRKEVTVTHQYYLQFRSELTEGELRILRDTLKEHGSKLKWTAQGSKPSEVTEKNIKTYASILHLLGHPSQIFKKPEADIDDAVLEHYLVGESAPTEAQREKLKANVLYRALDVTSFPRKAITVVPLDF